MVLKDADAGDGESTDEGRAMLQIVHDVAPDAKLAFRHGRPHADDFGGGDSFAARTTALADVIVDDITFHDEPFFPTDRWRRQSMTS